MIIILHVLQVVKKRQKAKQKQQKKECLYGVQIISLRMMFNIDT